MSRIVRIDRIDGRHEGLILGPHRAVCKPAPLPVSGWHALGVGFRIRNLTRRLSAGIAANVLFPEVTLRVIPKPDSEPNSSQPKLK